MADIAGASRRAGPLRVIVGALSDAFAAIRRTLGNGLRFVAWGIAWGVSRIPGASYVRAGYGRFARSLTAVMPKGIYQRSLIIIIAPIVLLQAVVAFIFMERHWATVTEYLSAATSRDIAAVVDLVRAGDGADNYAAVTRLARDRLNLIVSVLPPTPLPPAGDHPFFSGLDYNLAQELTDTVGLPFFIDTVGNSALLEIRIDLGDKLLQVFAERSQTYPSNSHIFILWMVGTSLVLITIAILFLRNQILPIQRLAHAAEEFGKGRPVPEFRPRGAREVRRASAAFAEMRERIARQIEQRTAMLAGVSHDLRTVLTRFRLQLALFGDNEDAREMNRDVDDMQRMLEGYMAFARGEGGEEAERTAIRPLLDRVADSARGVPGVTISVEFSGPPAAVLRPLGLRRCIGNLVRNAARHGDHVAITGTLADGWLIVTIDDNGPGIPEEERDAVFRPFYRLDSARNLDVSGTGLGLTIARDIARIHGGDITLDASPLGGLRAVVRIPA